MERLVLMEERLHPVGAGWHVVEALERVAEDGGVEARLFARRETVDVDAEGELGRRTIADLEPRLGARVPSRA